MSNLKVDTISSNATGSVTFQSQARLTQGAVVTGTLTATGGLTAAGIISSNTEIEGASLDINGNGDVSGQLTCGSLITDGAVSANSMYVQGVQLQPHIWAFASFDGSSLNSAKNLEAFTDDGAGNITFDFTDAPDDSSYVVIATNLGGTGGTLSVSAKTTASFTVQGVGAAGCDVLVLDQLVDETIDALAPPLIALDDLSDVSITNPTAKQILYYNGTEWRNVALSATDIASGTFADQRIAQSNVTQYESALSIDGTQLTNLSAVNLSAFNDDLNYAAPSHTHDAGDITTGIFSILRIPDLAASKITSGTFADARISSSSVTQHAGDIDLLDLGNVTGTIYGTGSGIYYDGANWVAGSLTATQIPSLDTSKITTGTFDDARISESSVTQHEAALAIAASQLTSGSLSIDLTPSADLTYSIGSENFRWADIHGDLDGAVTFRAKNDSGGVLTVGDIVYIKGVSGSTPTVDLADCSNAAKMPAFGMVKDASVNNGAETHIVTLGSVESVDVPSGTYTLGSNVYVGTAGTFTDSPPAGEGNLVQNIGWVARINTGAGPSGIIKVGGAGRTNAVPNLNDGNIFLGNASNQAVSTALSSINLSSFNNDLVLADDNWKRTPKNTIITRLFDDMLWANDRNHKGADFYALGTSSGFWQGEYGNANLDGETGILNGSLSANAYARVTVNGPILYANNAADGTEWLFETRVMISPNASATTSPSFSVGAFCPKTEHGSASTEQGFGYGDTAKAGVYWRTGNTYWKSYHYDTEGTNGGTTEVDLTSFSTAANTWVRVAIHCYKDTIFTVPTWVVKAYIDGTLATTQYLTSGTYAPTFYANMANSGEAYVNQCYIDWMTLQYTRPNSVSYLDIEDL